MAVVDIARKSFRFKIFRMVKLLKVRAVNIEMFCAGSRRSECWRSVLRALASGTIFAEITSRVTRCHEAGSRGNTLLTNKSRNGQYAVELQTKVIDS